MGLIPTFSKFQLDLLYCPVHKFIFKFLVISEIIQVCLCKGDRWPGILGGLEYSKWCGYTLL